ncbi:MAG: hypothetical protein KJ558_10115 [Gammaproteobacteria bacterium]|nr:hypothetical protein [Gammaproteobacteria bacterium]MBU1655161.1 hypothetical protein [Gammaproteobacteria bacterium]MBU1959972.1 hypothetical protein [Gammaproteobacteria bacterium]
MKQSIVTSPGVSQLESYVAQNGASLDIKGRAFCVEGVSANGNVAVGTFKAKKAVYTGVLCNNARVAGRPGAEVWSIISGNGRQVACFAVDAGQIQALTG